MKLKVLVMVVLLLGFGLVAEELVVPEVVVTVATPAAEESAVLKNVSEPVGETAAPAVKDGYALLNSLLTLFENLPVAKKGTEGENKQMNPGILEVDNRLSQLSKDAKNALETGLIDKIFYNRYRRMLMIFKMVITPVIKNELMENPFMEAFTEFVWNVTYEHWNWDDKDSIAKMAAAMEEEFVQMQFYMDTRQAREEFKKKIGKRILPPPPPPASAKKKPEVK